MTRFVVATLTAFACMLALVALDAQRAQAQAQPKKEKDGDTPTVSVRFRNDTKMTVLVQGYSVVKGMQRRGQPILIPPGRTNYDNNVPAGARFITVGDYNQSSRLLLRDFQLQVPSGRDIPVVIRTSPANPERVVLTPDQ